SVAKEPTGSGNTYVQVVKGNVKTGGRKTESIPVVFLDDECLMSNDFSMSLLGRVKEFASLANLKVALCNEGFVNIKIKYMGKLWVLLEFVTRESIKLFHDNAIIGSWFSQIIEASRDFVTNGRITWVEVEGEDDLVSGFEEEKQADNNVEERDVDDQENKSEDPFQIYKLLHKNNKVDRNEGVSDDGLKYPPGFTPYGSNDADSSNVVGDNNATVKVEMVNTIYEANEGSGGIRVNGISKANSTESGMSGHFKTSSLPRTGGSILGILDEVIKNGEVVIMGDFNEVRYKSDMYGSKFNAHSAMVFNSYILNSSLVEVSLGRCSFTWCHKTAAKMSKLDRFLVSESFLNSCPNINAITLESNKDAKAHLKLELEVVDLGIDNGNRIVEDIKRRGEIVNKLQDIDKLHALETAQKAKVKWVVEGDENSSFFHGILNKKRNLLNIRGVMFDGVWVDNLIKISVDQKRNLEGEVTNDEIKKVVWDGGTDKAPGPDGFTFGFYRKF
nr:RNA-directed DNA polymerase, eukaryota [Tanacetum cinerariifolium]